MGYVYKHTIKENGKWYIGSHNGNKPKYKGSGLLWQKALKKYGIDSFTTEILYEGELFREEEDRILKKLKAAEDAMSYNMKNEALGGSFPGELNGMFNKKLSDEQKYICGSAFRGKKRPEHSIRMLGQNNPMYGKSDHAYGLLKRSTEISGKTYEEIYGKDKAKEHKEKMSIALKGKSKPIGFAENMMGSNNHASKSVIIDYVTYSSIVEAMSITGLSRYLIKKLNNGF